MARESQKSGWWGSFIQTGASIQQNIVTAYDRLIISGLLGQVVCYTGGLYPSLHIQALWFFPHRVSYIPQAILAGH